MAVFVLPEVSGERKKMTYRKRIDMNQPGIVAALRQAGYYCYPTFRLGAGFPDLLVVGKCGGVMLMEIKQPGEKLTEDEIIFHQQYPGRVCIAQTVEQAIQIMQDFDCEED